MVVYTLQRSPFFEISRDIKLYVLSLGQLQVLTWYNITAANLDFQYLCSTTLLSVTQPGHPSSMFTLTRNKLRRYYILRLSYINTVISIIQPSFEHYKSRASRLHTEDHNIYTPSVLYFIVYTFVLCKRCCTYSQGKIKPGGRIFVLFLKNFSFKISREGIGIRPLRLRDGDSVL